MGLCPRHPLVQVDQVALVDACWCGIDDYEHFGGEVLAPSVENHARYIDGFRVVRALLQIEAECRKPVLAVDDEELGLRLCQLPDPVGAPRLEAQFFRGKQQHRSRDRRLGDRRLIEVLELAHLGPGKGSLEGAIIALDLGDELGDLVFLRDARRGDLLTFAVKTADEADLGEQLGSADAAEVEDAILLANLRGKHGSSLVSMAQPLAQTGNIAETGRPLRKKRVQRPGPALGRAGAAPCGLLVSSGRWTLQRAGPKRAAAREVPCATPSRKESSLISIW